MTIQLLFFLLFHAATRHESTASEHEASRHSLAASEVRIDVQPCLCDGVCSDSQLRCSVATFFVDAFWKDYKAEAEMTVEQKRRLANEQYDDMRQRLVNKSAKLLFRDECLGERAARLRA